MKKILFVLLVVLTTFGVNAQQYYGADEDTILRTTARRVSETIKQLRG